jgi:hypothetical protein
MPVITMITIAAPSSESKRGLRNNPVAQRRLRGW